MDSIGLLRELLPAEIVDNFDIVKYEKTKEAFDIWFDEKKFQEEDDATNEHIVAYGFSEYKSIRDFPLRGIFTRLHLRKRKWLDKETGETLRQIMARSKRIMMRNQSKWNDRQKKRAKILFEHYPMPRTTMVYP